jgi:hypothetical protein
MVADRGTFERTRGVRNLVAVLDVHTGVDDLIRVAYDRQVGIVGYDKNLSAFTRLPDAIDQDLGDRVVVQIALRLIDDQRHVPFVDQQVKDK